MWCQVLSASLKGYGLIRSCGPGRIPRSQKPGSGKPLGRVVGKPLNCHSRANSRDTGLGDMPNRRTSGIVGGSDITIQRPSPSRDQSERAPCILHIDIVPLSDLLSALPHPQPCYCQQNNTLNALYPPPPTDVCVIGGAWLLTQHELGGLPGKDHCNVWTNDD